MLRLSEGK